MVESVISRLSYHARLDSWPGRGLKRLAFWKKESPPTRIESMQEAAKNLWTKTQKVAKDLWKKTQKVAKDLWTNHRIATIATAGVVAVVVVGVVGYLALKRP